MHEIIRYNLKMIILIFLVIVITHTVFFIIYSYCMSGDAFLALKNFYGTVYNI